MTKRIKSRCENAWADYLTEFCDGTRIDEAVSLLGWVVLCALAGVLLAKVVPWCCAGVGVSLACLTQGQEVYAVPLMAVSIWTRRGLGRPLVG